MHPWLSHYDDGVPHSLAPYPDGTLVERLAELASTHPGKPAILFKGASVSYAELHRQSDRFAAALAARGVVPGSRVALLLPNCPQFLVAQFGVWKAGGVVVALNPTYSERELEQALDGTRAEIAVVLTPFYQRLKQVQGRTALRLIVATSIKEHLPRLARLVFTLVFEKKGGHRISLAAGDAWLPDLLRAHARTPPPPVRVSGDDPAVILSSGGTTGTPKGVVGLHRHYTTAGLQLNEWLRSAKTPWTDVIMLPLPLFHVYGNVGVLPLAMMGPHPLSLIPNPRDLSDVLRTIQKVRPAFLGGVPTLFTAILNHPDVKQGKVSLRSLRICFSGAAPLMAETKRQFEDATGARIVEGYSLTEAMMACCLNPMLGEQKIGSIGLPLPDVEVRIVDAETGDADVPQGEVGELLIRAPQLMAGYWNNPLETAETLRTHGPGGPWLHTGDLVRRDEQGYLFIVDRKKDMVKTSGFQVWPREIEEVIAAHPAVREVGVAGVPDAARGEVPHAWIVLKTGEAVEGDEIRSYCRERLAPYKVPARVHFRDDLPKTMVGKVLRRVLAAEAAEAAGTPS